MDDDDGEGGQDLQSKWTTDQNFPLIKQFVVLSSPH